MDQVSASRQQICSLPDLQRIGRLGHIVHTHDARATWRQPMPPPRHRQALAHRSSAGDRTERGLARPARQHRQAQRQQRLLARISAVVLDPLAEADARIRHDALARRRVPPLSHPAGQMRDHPATTSSWCGANASCAARRHVHQAQAAGRMGRNRIDRTRGAQRGDIVDDVPPRSSARRITSGLQVSTDTATPRPSAWRSTGSMRRHSSSTGTGSAPGRVDSPPMSRMSAPCPISVSQCRSEAAGSRPPSEKEPAWH